MCGISSRLGFMRCKSKNDQIEEFSFRLESAKDAIKIKISQREKELESPGSNCVTLGCHFLFLCFLLLQNERTGLE